MPKMGIKSRVISMTRSDTWTTNIAQETKRNSIADFCLYECPHKDKACDGDCAEIKAYIKELRGRKK